MHAGIIVETNNSERIWIGFRLANTVLNAAHCRSISARYGIEAPDHTYERFNPSRVMRTYLNDGGDLYACGTWLEARDLDPNEFRPRATMNDRLRTVEVAENILTTG